VSAPREVLRPRPAPWTELKFLRAKRGLRGYDVVDLTHAVTLGFVWPQHGHWLASAFLPDDRVVPVWEDSPDGAFRTRRAAARAVELRVAREPDEVPEKPAPELAEQPRLVFGGRR